MNFDEGIRGRVSRASNLTTLAFVSHFLVLRMHRCEPKISGHVASAAIQLTTSIFWT